jgi:hypothetical protein
LIQPSIEVHMFKYLAASVVFVSCQSYDFEKVSPVGLSGTHQFDPIIARGLKPNLMLLVDQSKSMSDPIVPNCTGPNCATRISELKSAMATFTSTAGTVARLGLSLFPAAANVCAAPIGTRVAFPLPSVGDVGTDAVLQAKADEINQAIAAIVPLGGTPTAASLQFLGNSVPGLSDSADQRANFVLLLTDGLPNCNNVNPNNVCASQANASVCACTQAAGCSGSICATGCLDSDGTVAQIQALQAKNIKTIVVGFGSDFAGGGLATLNAMAEAGGFSRSCPKLMNSECGSGDTCDVATKLCKQKFYQAANGAELTAALKAIVKVFEKNPCEYGLAQLPKQSNGVTDYNLLSVNFAGQSLPSGSTTWLIEGDNLVFKGTYCQQLLDSTPASPVQLDVRSVQIF